MGVKMRLEIVNQFDGKQHQLTQNFNGYGSIGGFVMPISGYTRVCALKFHFNNKKNMKIEFLNFNRIS